jgi:hypothetical protein
MNVHPPHEQHSVLGGHASERLQDIGQRLELLRRQGVGEVLLDGPQMGCGRTPEHSRSVVGQGDLGTTAVGGAVVATDQTTPLHPSEVMDSRLRSQSMLAASCDDRSRLPSASLNAGSTW